MKLRNLLETVDDIKEKNDGNLRDKIQLKMKDLYSVIQHFEDSGEIRKEDTEKIDTFKKFIQHFIKEEENKKILRDEK